MNLAKMRAELSYKYQKVGNGAVVFVGIFGFHARALRQPFLLPCSLGLRGSRLQVCMHRNVPTSLGSDAYVSKSEPR